MKNFYYIKLALVFIALAFLSLQNISAQNCWSALGAGAGTNNGGGAVAAFTNYNGNLIVGGVFQTAGGMPASNIGLWNGSSWSALGSGVNTIIDNFGVKTSVAALAVYNNELYAGGRFDTAGGVYASSIAKWNGTSWSPVGGGITGYTHNGNDSLRAAVYAMSVYNGELYVAGNFTAAGGVPAHEIAKWNGSSWSAVAAGLATGENNSVRTVVCLAVANSKLFAGGAFQNASGIHASNIAAWDGNTWSAVGAGLGVDTPGKNGVTSMALYQGNICASVTTNDGQGNPVYYISKWDGNSWSSIAGGPGTGVTFPGYVFALLPLNGYLYAGGQFNDITNLSNLDGVAKWNGTAWSGVGDTTGSNFLFALGSYNSNIITGGFFTSTAGVSTINVAEYSCTATGISESTVIENIKIFPNPFSNQFTICLADNEPAIITLHNFIGQQVLQQTFTNSTIISTAQMPNGIYFYELRNPNGVMKTGKLVKQ